jgi:hypothetical protein
VLQGGLKEQRHIPLIVHHKNALRRRPPVWCRSLLCLRRPLETQWLPLARPSSPLIAVFNRSPGSLLVQAATRLSQPTWFPTRYIHSFYHKIRRTRSRLDQDCTADSRPCHVRQSWDGSNAGRHAPAAERTSAIEWKTRCVNSAPPRCERALSASEATSTLDGVGDRFACGSR